MINLIGGLRIMHFSFLNQAIRHSQAVGNACGC